MSVFHNNALIGAGGGTAAAADGTGAIATKSLRFNSGDTAFLNKTFSSAGNRKTFTFSCWVKRVKLGVRQFIFEAGSSDTATDRFMIRFQSDDTLMVTVGQATNRQTTQVFRDVGAWASLVVAVDTTASTANDRIKIYWNGSQITDFSSTSNPSQNANTGVSSAAAHSIGKTHIDNSHYLDAYLADIYLIDGLQLEPTSFGAYDSNGVWQAAAYSGTFGTNGFYLGFGDSSDLGADDSGNNNDFTPNNLTGHTVQTYPGVAFDGPTNGASVATGYLSIPASNSSDFNFGTGDFTWEAFILGYDWTGGSSNDDMQVIDHGPTAGGNNSGFFVDGGQSYYYSNKASSRNVITGPTLENGRWYHVAASRDNGTLRLFVDGVSQGSASYTDDYADAIFTLGRNEDNNKNQFRGVISNFRVLKGTALYTSNFTVPTTPLTNITNTKLLCCQSSSSATTATVTPATIVANGGTNGTERSDSRGSNDSLFDVPTNDTTNTDSGAGGEVSANYATWNPLNSANTLSNGNLTSNGAGGLNQCLSTIGMSSGKWYFEATIVDNTDNQGVGIALKPTPGTFIGNTTSGYLYYGNGTKRHSTTNTVVADSFTDGDVVGIAFDADAGNLYFYKNGVAQISGSAAFTGLTSGPYFFTVDQDNTSAEIDANFGQRKFAYDAPSNYKALCTKNLPTPTIADGSDHFATSLWTVPSGSANTTISGLSFGPDLLLTKNRSQSYEGSVYDTVRGDDKYLKLFSSSGNVAETTAATRVNLTSDGFVLEADNDNSNYTAGSASVGWAWNAGTSTASNTDGSITSSVRASAASGFSIVTWTGNGSSSASVGHGLSAAPDIVAIKCRSSTTDWHTYVRAIDANGRYQVYLNKTNGKTDFGSAFFDADSSVINLSSSSLGINGNSSTYVSYCFSPVAGYSAIGSVDTNGTTDNAFIYLGFRAKFIMFKRFDSTGNWTMWDTSRNTFNVMNKYLFANSNIAEGTDSQFDILSNGIKLRTTGFASGGEFLYYAVAENPFQANGGLAR